MLRLIVMRHAKSDWGQKGLSDHDRPLNTRGKAAAKSLGEWLRAKGHLPDQVLSSSAERTGQTFLGLGFDHPIDTSFTRALYHADADGMLRVLQGATGACVLMIGHNPGIAEFAERLLDQPVSHDRFFDYPTGATLVADFDQRRWNDIGWHQGQPIDFVIPRELP